MSELTENPAAESHGSFLGDLVWKDGWAVLLIVFLTVAIELGAYWQAVSMGQSVGNALAGAMAVAAVWLAIAAPAAAVWGSDTRSATIRCAAVADASGIVLIVLWLAFADETGRTSLTFGSIVRIYCVLAVMAVVAMAFVCACRSLTGRSIMAITASISMFAALASPFWAGWWLTGDNTQTNQTAATWLVAVNPYFAILTCLNDIRASAFDWLTADVMYQITRMSDYVAPRRVDWYETAGFWLVLAMLACVVRLVVGMLRPKDQPKPA